MFAFAIWDARRQRLFCARDRLGIKPFYYYWDGRLFAFASEIKALLEHPAISPALEEDVLPEMLAFGYTSGDRTLFRNIRKLMPAIACCSIWAARSRSSRSSATGTFRSRRRRQQDLDDAEWIAETRRRLEETVEMHLMSDVPLGVFLSGGVDSSAIAALSKRAISRPVQTFAVGYSEAKFSELSYARQVAQRHRHRIITRSIIGMDDFFGALPKLIWHEDEPIAWPSSVPLYFVSKLAAAACESGADRRRQRRTVRRLRALSLAWLLNQRWAARYGIVPGAAAALRFASGSRRRPLLSAGLRRKLRQRCSAANLALNRCSSRISIALFEAGARLRTETTCATGTRGPTLRPLARMLYADQKTYLVELLMKQDQMSMAASIESRVPFLDHTFVEFAARIPDRLKIRGRTQKYILKRSRGGSAAARHHSPQEDGLSHALARMAARSARRAALRRLAFAAMDCWRLTLDLREVDALIDRHRSGLEDATDRIWRLLNLQLWGDLFLTGRRDGGGPEPAARTRAMKILWVKSDFLHPTTSGGQIRTLETLKRLHRRHEIHYAALDLADSRAACARSSEYCTKAYPIPHPRPAKARPAFWAAARQRALFAACRWRCSRYRSAPCSARWRR